MKLKNLVSFALFISTLAFASSLPLMGQTAKSGTTSTISSEGMMFTTGTFDDSGSTAIFLKSDDEKAAMNWSVFIDGNGKIVKAILDNLSVRELYIDGGKIHAEDIHKFASSTKPLIERLIAEKEIEKLENEIDASENEIESKENEFERVAEKIDKAESRIDELEEKGNVDLSSDRDQLSILRERLGQARDLISAKRDSIATQRYRLLRQRDNLESVVDDINRVLTRIASDLKAEGVINNTNKLSFKLSNREFIVNGKRLSDQMHESFKWKYIVETKGETGFLYHWKGKI